MMMLTINFIDLAKVIFTDAESPHVSVLSRVSLREAFEKQYETS
jgi:hypothetical protein